jgi:cysteine sulfinate desulfinase/cysteine desulfurase-like protein
MGLCPELASAHLRLTLGRGTTVAEVERAGQLISREVAALRQSQVPA